MLVGFYNCEDQLQEWLQNNCEILGGLSNCAEQFPKYLTDFRNSAEQKQKCL
jgi:hypothetical protein